MTTLDGAQVEVELGEQANVNLVGIVGPVGPQGPMGPPGGPMAGYFTPQQFGAVGDGVANDTAAVQAAISAASTAKGGVVYFPPGTYNCSQQLKYWRNTEWIGAGVGASWIKLTTDLWDGLSTTPARFIVAGQAMQQGAAFKMSDLRIGGPGANASPGQTPSHTTGLQSASGIILNNLFVGGGFFAGVEIIADHERLHNVYSTGNYYNLDYSDAHTSGANQAYFSCNFAGCGLASIHVSGKGFIQSSTFQQVHLGVGPVGIFMTDNQNGWDGSGNPLYTGGTVRAAAAIQSTTFGDAAFESIANAGILDISTGGQPSIITSNIYGNQPVSWNATYYTTNAPLNNVNYQAAWTLVLRNACIGGRLATLVSSPPTTGHALGVLNMVTNNATPLCVFDATGPPANFYGSGATAAGWTAQHGGFGRFQFTYGGFVARGGYSGNGYGYLSAAAVINAGDLVELLGTATGWIQRATGTKPVLGVALTPSPGTVNGAMVVVQTDGVTVINATVNNIQPGTALYTDPTTTYMVTNVTTSNRIIGMCMSGGTGAAGAELRFGAA